MAKIIFITNENKAITIPDNSNLLRASIREKGGIPFKCGGGLCGTCKCLIEKGLENTDAIKDKERRHLTEADFAAGHRMACQTFVVSGDISVSWIPLAQRTPAARPAPMRVQARQQAIAPENKEDAGQGSPEGSTQQQ
jgi:ferredoxin